MDSLNLDQRDQFVGGISELLQEFYDGATLYHRKMNSSWPLKTDWVDFAHVLKEQYAKEEVQLGGDDQCNVKDGLLEEVD